MGQILQLWNRLSVAQRVTLAVVAAAAFAAVYFGSNYARESDFRPLFVGLGPEEASHIISKLKEQGSEYRLEDGGTRILVPSAQLNELRLKLAGDGLPEKGRLGFEIFDKTNFGASEFTEQINYQRALEGELERTIVTIGEVEQARVHITAEKESLFEERRQPAKASIVLKLRSGRRLSPSSVRSIANLTASAVKGLDPGQVAIVDTAGNLLNRPKEMGSDDNTPSESLEFRQQIERDLTAKIGSTLEPLLGPDRFRVGVSAECDFSSGEQSEEVFDPTKSVMTSSERTEETSSGRPTAGVPGTASSLPRASARPIAASSGTTRRSENVKYETSRSVRKTILPRGTVKRLSVSVLVDQQVRVVGTGKDARRVVEPLSKESLDGIRDVVSGLMGFQQGRGDQLVVQNLPFANTITPVAFDSPPAAAPPPAWQQYLPYALAGGGLLAGVLLAVLIMGTRKKKGGRAHADQATLPSGSQAGPHGIAPPDRAAPSLAEQIQQTNDERERRMSDELAKLSLPPAETSRSAILTTHMNREAKKTPEGIAQVVRTWMSETEGD